MKRALENSVAVAVAGLLWLLAGVPVVTIGPATAALFGVYADWTPGAPPPTVWATFWARFRRHFRNGLVLGVIATIVLAVLSVDLWYGLAAPNAPLRPVVLAAAIVGFVVTACALVFLFPLLVAYDWTWREALRRATPFAAGFFGTTLLGLLVWALAVLAIFWLWFALPFAVAAAAFAISRLTGRAFERYETLRAVQNERTHHEQ